MLHYITGNGETYMKRYFITALIYVLLVGLSVVVSISFVFL